MPPRLLRPSVMERLSCHHCACCGGPTVMPRGRRDEDAPAGVAIHVLRRAHITQAGDARDPLETVPNIGGLSSSTRAQPSTGLWEMEWDKRHSPDAPDPETLLRTRTVLTTAAGPDMKKVHDRMPRDPRGPSPCLARSRTRPRGSHHLPRVISGRTLRKCAIDTAVSPVTMDPRSFPCVIGCSPSGLQKMREAAVSKSEIDSYVASLKNPSGAP